MPPNSGTRQHHPAPPAPRACRQRVGIPVKWPLADVPGSGELGKMVPHMTPCKARMRRPPHTAHLHPRAGGRGDGPRAGGAGTGRFRAKRVMATRPHRRLSSGGLNEFYVLLPRFYPGFAEPRSTLSASGWLSM